MQALWGSALLFGLKHEASIVELSLKLLKLLMFTADCVYPVGVLKNLSLLCEVQFLCVLGVSSKRQV